MEFVPWFSVFGGKLLIQKQRIAALDKPSRFAFTDRPDSTTPVRRPTY